MNLAEAHYLIAAARSIHDGDVHLLAGSESKQGKLVVAFGADADILELRESFDFVTNDVDEVALWLTSTSAFEKMRILLQDFDDAENMASAQMALRAADRLIEHVRVVVGPGRLALNEREDNGKED
jgi:hypothetical protein